MNFPFDKHSLEHHFIRNLVNLYLNWTKLQTSLLRPFSNVIYSLYRKSHRECQVIWIEQSPYFITITYAETLSDGSGRESRFEIELVRKCIPNMDAKNRYSATTSESKKKFNLLLLETVCKI